MPGSQKIRVCLAGVTGWAGSALAKAMINSTEIELVSGISRKHAGQRLSDVFDTGGNDIPVFASASEALAVVADVFFEYSHPDVARQNVITALHHGLDVVIGTSGLNEEDYREIHEAAMKAGKGVLAVGNFAITVVLLNKFAEIAARYIPNWEIIDFAHDAKPDAPSGSALELAARLQQVRESSVTIPVEETFGIPETRGARINGSQVHSLRLPSFVISLEAIFGQEGERLSIRHDGLDSPVPYVGGALLAIMKVSTFTGLKRGLDKVMPD